MTANKTKWVRLGDYIELCDERNSELLHREDACVGVNIEKELKLMRGNLESKKFDLFYLVPPHTFVFNPRGSRKLGLGFNNSKSTYITTFNNIVFRVVSEELLSEFLYLFLSRKEFDRYAETISWGSSTEVFGWNTLCDILIPLPSLEVQRDLVEAYEGLKRLAEGNETLIAPLTEACQAFIVDCKRKYQEVQLGEFIEEVDERNSDLSVTLSQGIDVNMTFIPAKREAGDKQNTKIVREDQFAYNKVVKSNGTKLPLALRKGEPCFISSSYSVFRIIDEACIIPEFLFLLLSRSEFHRYCGYKAEGTTRDVFSFSELCRVHIPLPPLEVQQSIVRLYHCIEEARSIATEARERLTKLCPALVQRAIHS